MIIKKGETYIIRFGLSNVHAKVEAITEENGRTYIGFRTENQMYDVAGAADFKQKVEQASIIPLKELEEVEV